MSQWILPWALSVLFIFRHLIILVDLTAFSTLNTWCRVIIKLIMENKITTVSGIASWLPFSPSFHQRSDILQLSPMYFQFFRHHLTFLYLPVCLSPASSWRSQEWLFCTIPGHSCARKLIALEALMWRSWGVWIPAGHQGMSAPPHLGASAAPGPSTELCWRSIRTPWAHLGRCTSYPLCMCSVLPGAQHLWEAGLLVPLGELWTLQNWFQKCCQRSSLLTCSYGWL